MGRRGRDHSGPGHGRGHPASPDLAGRSPIGATVTAAGRRGDTLTPGRGRRGVGSPQAELRADLSRLEDDVGPPATTEPGDMLAARGGSVEMADQRAKGTVNKVRGTFEQWLGRLTGKRRMRARGAVRQAQGGIQQGVGDVQDAVHRHEGDVRPH